MGMNCLREFVSNSRYPSAGASEGGMRGTLQVALQPPCQIPGNLGNPGMNSGGSLDEFRQVIFCWQAADIQAIGPELEVHLAWNWRSSWPGISPVGPENHFGLKWVAARVGDI